MMEDRKNTIMYDGGIDDLIIGGRYMDDGLLNDGDFDD